MRMRASIKLRKEAIHNIKPVMIDTLAHINPSNALIQNDLVQELVSY